MGFRFRICNAAYNNFIVEQIQTVKTVKTYYERDFENSVSFDSDKVKGVETTEVLNTYVLNNPFDIFRQLLTYICEPYGYRYFEGEARKNLYGLNLFGFMSRLTSKNLFDYSSFIPFFRTVLQKEGDCYYSPNDFKVSAGACSLKSSVLLSKSPNLYLDDCDYKVRLRSFYTTCFKFRDIEGNEISWSAICNWMYYSLLDAFSTTSAFFKYRNVFNYRLDTNLFGVFMYVESTDSTFDYFYSRIGDDAVQGDKYICSRYSPLPFQYRKTPVPHTGINYHSFRRCHMLSFVNRTICTIAAEKCPDSEELEVLDYYGLKYPSSRSLFDSSSDYYFRGSKYSCTHSWKKNFKVRKQWQKHKSCKVIERNFGLRNCLKSNSFCINDDLRLNSTYVPVDVDLPCVFEEKTESELICELETLYSVEDWLELFDC